MAAQHIAGFQDYHADLVRLPIRQTADPARAADIAQVAHVRKAPCPQSVREVPRGPGKGQKEATTAAIDQPKVELPKRVQPLPKPPENVIGDPIDQVVPVEFFMR